MVVFSGVVECQARILDVHSRPGAPGEIRISLERPISFDDVQVGNSISVNGCCLTVETMRDDKFDFFVSSETMCKTGWTLSDLVAGKKLNLERSLIFGQRVHGHLVTGHVDGSARVVAAISSGQCLILDLEIPFSFHLWMTTKGSIALNGVSLTINSCHLGERSDHIKALRIQVCVIPETLRNTNLCESKVGDYLTFECDYLARAVSQAYTSRIVDYGK